MIKQKAFVLPPKLRNSTSNFSRSSTRINMHGLNVLSVNRGIQVINLWMLFNIQSFLLTSTLSAWQIDREENICNKTLLDLSPEEKEATLLAEKHALYNEVIPLQPNAIVFP
ncbi:uncharacterized protein LOC116118852 [Pistacia vera]|uniref:uncharacterized protein LOC116118852 n=1 Tax=Pistacia vera TaxID=55513 RepID=UPI0012638F53|nr:uncharacterized protein LOC116118852 [Pistacia vera]XP_031260677.1 uncharacterized protein LOC116118852 [Pistacia vera]XP_031260678.1 uncharacterized protein LOC116118852 [Pistacia vera]XP_031260679.1 uncharacterized protein LOC116118852 [Pistacia vera]XP_031260680.1 uncharacterized protein LOC116118852 [Pistacia vera]